MKNLSIFEPQIEKHYAYKKKHVFDKKFNHITVSYLFLGVCNLNGSDLVVRCRPNTNKFCPADLENVQRQQFMLHTLQSSASLKTGVTCPKTNPNHFF